jgi:Immunoglobulin domain
MKSGVYISFAENSEGKAENLLNFKIVAEPNMLDDFDESKESISIREGDDLDLLCPFENFDEISWERNDVLLHDQTSQNLKINKINKHFTGKFKCLASNSIGMKSFMYKVDLLTAPTIAVLDEKISSVVFTSLDVQENMMEIGQTLELSCEVQGNPKPTIQWSKSGIETTQQELLRIENLTSNDAGSYTCTAQNTQGVAKKIVKVEVSSAPFIENGTKMVKEERSVGEELTLECKIGGSPKPIFFWTKDQ